MKQPAINSIMTIGALGIILPVPAWAHWGHLGELAGHGHLVAAGLGTLAVMGVVGLAVLGKKDDQGLEEAAEASEATTGNGDKSHA